MEQAGFLEIRIEDPGQDPSDKAGAAASTYVVRIGWMQDVPYLIDLGSDDRVSVNGTPIEPLTPVAIHAADTIIIGHAYLSWNAGMEAGQPSQEAAVAEAPRATVVLPPEDIAKPGPETASPGGSVDDVAPPEAADATLQVPKRPAEPQPPLEPDVTLLVPKKAAKPPLPGAPGATLQVPKRPAEPPPPDAPDKTLLVPKVPAEPSAPEVQEATLLVPKRPAEPSPRGIPGEGPVDPAIPAEWTGATATYGTAWIDMAQILEEGKDLEFESTTLLRDTQVPHLVFHLPDRTWEVQLTDEPMTVGRSRSNDLSIADESVSHRHARIERRGDGYVIRDTHSRNGLWLGKQRIEEHQLRHGDVLSLGRAKMVFKGAFTSDELTLIGAPRIDGSPVRRPVVFVPGLMGSELWIGSERLWPNVKTILSNPEVFRLPGDPRIEARGIVNDVVIIPHLVQSRQYSAMGDYLEQGLGYTRGKDLLEFSYDWRHDVRLSAQRLAEAIDSWGVQAPLTIIAHSLGTLVTRYYVERLGGKRDVERIILMGGPHYGTPKGLAAILSGPGFLPLGMADERLRAVLGTFLSAYQILPIYPCIVDQDGNNVDILEDDSWLPEHQRPYLGAARSFRRELGTVSSVRTVSIFGYGLKTKLRVKIDRRPDGQWQKVEFEEDMAGDQSVPAGSAVLKGSEIHPVLQEHGSLYVDDDVRMRLKVELTRSTTWQRR